MKKLSLIIFSLLLSYGVYAESYTLTTPKSQIVLSGKVGSDLKFHYYGSRASIEDIYGAGITTSANAFNGFGAICDVPSYACIVKFANGDHAINLKLANIKQVKGENINSVIATLTDAAHPFSIKLHYDAYQDCDIFAFWAEYINADKKHEITLQKYMSAFLPIKSQDCYLLSLNGDHGNECNQTIEKLNDGIKILSTQDCSRPTYHNQPAFMLGTDGKLCENEGNTIAGVLDWTGNFQIEFIKSLIDKEPIQIYAGINPTGSDYILSANSTFTSPKLYLTYSHKGMGEASRNLHFFTRNHLLLDGTQPRDILLNSWEGVHLAVSQEGMNEMMTDFSALGGEMFVMDDGWFGDKYPRNKDNSSLGDWSVAKSKLPNGIDGLIRFATDKNLKFGIWIEPEMVNTISELYETHPDWVLRHPNFEPKKGRGQTQLLLDLTNPKVQDFVVGVVDNLMQTYPQIAYIKWDHNMSMSNCSSLYLPTAKQSNLYVDYQLSLIKILKRIRAKYPKLIMQDCSSGGERLCYGFMPYFQEAWGSDQTDPLHRIYIQWGTLNFYPSNFIAAHVCCSISKYEKRYTPLKFRFDVASMCRLGMEMVPAQLNDSERNYAKRAIAEYKRLRNVIQQGDMYKLISPYEGNHNYASLMYVEPNKDHAVLFAYRLQFLRHSADKIIRLNGLDPNKKYLIKEVCPENENKKCSINGKIINGDLLINQGISIKELEQNPSIKDASLRQIEDYRSIVLELIAQ